MLRKCACAARAALRRRPSCSAEAPRSLLQRRARPAAWSEQHSCPLSSSATTEPVVVHRTTAAATGLAEELAKTKPEQPTGKAEKLAPFNPVGFKALPHFDREKSIAQTQNTVRELYSEGSYKEALEAAEVLASLSRNMLSNHMFCELYHELCFELDVLICIELQLL
jgi:hypothetical protein